MRSSPWAYEVSTAGAPSRAAAVRHAAVTAVCACCVDAAPLGGQIQRISYVHMEPRAAQRRRDQACELLARAARDDPTGTGLSDGHHGRPGASHEPGHAAAERSGRGFRGVGPAGEAALGVDQDQVSLLQRLGGRVQCVGGAPVAAVDGYVPFAGEGATEHRYAPQPGGGHDDRAGAEPVQRREHDGGVGERGVVRDDDAARGEVGVVVGGDGQTAYGRHHEVGEAAEHVCDPLGSMCRSSSSAGGVAGA